MDVRGQYIKGNEAFATGNYGEALQLFLSLMVNDSEDEGLLLKISQCYQESESYDEAIEFLEKLLRLDIEKGDFKKAVAVCKRILSIDPDDTEVIVKLANIYRKIGQYGEASYYYRIAAQHYEYAGFMDKAIEMLQIVKELGQEGVEDLLEIIKNEYKRGARTKASRNIEQIIKELKEGGEYGLLDVALNLALSNTSDAFFYVEELSDLYFKTGRLKACSRLCLWGIHLKPASASMYYRLAKSFWALGLEDTSRKVMGSIVQGDIIIDDQDYIAKFTKMLDVMDDFEKERNLSVGDYKEESVESYESELSYLEREKFTNVNHTKIDLQVMQEEFDKKLEESTEDRTQVIDLKRKSKFSPKVLDGLREAEILMSEGFYDKAGVKLFSLLEEDPGNEDIKTMLNKAIKLSGSMDHVPVHSNYSDDKRTIDEISLELERYVGINGLASSDYELINIFSSKLENLLVPQDYLVLCDIGIAYMEMELWQEASDSFEKVVSYLENNRVDDNKLFEAKIYYAYCKAMSGGEEQKQVTALYFKNILSEDLSKRLRLSAMYYLAVCYEHMGDIGNSSKIYKDIAKEEPEYRDAHIRASVLEK